MKNYSPHFVEKSPDLIEMSKGGGCLGCFGLPFFGAGIFMLLMTMQVIPVSNANELNFWAWFTMGLMALVFTAVGAGLVFGRSWISINRTQRRIWKYHGLLRPMRGEIYSFDDYDAILLTHNEGDSDTAETFPLSLRSIRGAELNIASFMNYKDAREQALLLRDFMELSLYDATTDNAEEVKAAPTETTEPKFTNRSKPIVLHPDEYPRIQINQRDSRLEIGLYGPKFSFFSMLEFIIPLGILFFIGPRVYHFFIQTKTPTGISNAFIGFFLFFFILIPLISVIKRGAMAHRVVSSLVLDDNGISIVSNARKRAKALTLPWNSIVSIDIKNNSVHNSQNLRDLGRKSQFPQTRIYHHNVPQWVERLSYTARSRGLVIKSTNGLYYFGAGVTQDEAKYLLDVVLNSCTKEDSTNRY